MATIIIVVDTALVFEQKLELASIATDVELASCWKTQQEQNQCFSRKANRIVHGATSVDQENVFFACTFFNLLGRFYNPALRSCTYIQALKLVSNFSKEALFWLFSLSHISFFLFFVIFTRRCIDELCLFRVKHFGR